MERTTCIGTTRSLAPTIPPSVPILVALVRAVSALRKRSLWDGGRENWGTSGREVEEGYRSRGLVTGLSWRTSRGLAERRGREARGD